MKLASRLAPIELACVDADGTAREVALGAFWAERPVVLVFIRHFG